MKPRRLTPIWLVVFCSACGVQTCTSVHYLAPDLGPVDTVALLPPRLFWQYGSEPRAYVERTLSYELATQAGIVVSRVSSLLARKAFVDVDEIYEQLLVNRARTGVLDSATVVLLGTRLGVQHMLFASLTYTGDDPEESCVLLLKAELWDGKTGLIGWHAAVTAFQVPDEVFEGWWVDLCEENGLDLVDAAVADLAQVFLAPHRGKGRDPNSRR